MWKAIFGTSVAPEAVVVDVELDVKVLVQRVADAKLSYAARHEKG